MNIEVMRQCKDVFVSCSRFLHDFLSISELLLMGVPPFEADNGSRYTWMHYAMVMTLREMVVDYLRKNENDPAVNFAVFERVNDEFPALINSDTSITFRNFLQVLAQEGVWGAGETYLAIARMFQRDIIILRQLGYSNKIDADVDGPPNIPISIVYSGPTNQWNHYSSFIRFDVLSSGSINPNVPTSQEISTPLH